MTEGIPRWVLLLGLTVLTLCFGVAYHWGTTSQRTSILVPLDALRQQATMLQKDADTCEKRRNKLYESMSKNNNTLYKALVVANETHGKLLAQEQDADYQSTTCTAELENQRARQDQAREDGKANMVTLTALTNELGDLTAEIDRLRGGLGMQRTLLLDSLRLARIQHFKLRRKQNEPMPPDMGEYEAELLAKYTPNVNETNITVDVVGAEITNSSDYIQGRVEAFIKAWQAFHYNASEHPKVFMPANDGPGTNDTCPRPVWFNRTAPDEEALGVALRPQRAPIRTTAFQVKALTSIGLCALRHDNANLTFPLMFRRVDNASTMQYLNETFETPLVTYCRRCTSALSSMAYRVACGKDSPNKLYGTYDFWAARSLIRPTQAVIDGARATFNQAQLAGRNILAVAFKNPPQLRQKCRFRQTPQRHYLWARALTAATNGTLFHAVASANRTEQCQPSLATLFDAVEALRQKFKIDAILVSVESQADLDIIRAADFGGAAQVVAYRPTSSFQDAVDIVLASWATHILVNRYADHSQVLTEAFALRNNITASRIHFF
jgi:hypothetical protein